MGISHFFFWLYYKHILTQKLKWKWHARIDFKTFLYLRQQIIPLKIQNQLQAILEKPQNAGVEVVYSFMKKLYVCIYQVKGYHIIYES